MQDKILYWGSFLALCAISFLSFVSISLSALNHILLLLAGFPLIIKYSLFPKKLPLSSWVIILLLILGIISNLNNELSHPLKSFSPIKYFFFSLMGMLVYQELFNKEEFKQKFFWLLKPFLIISSIATLSGLIAYYTGWNPLKWHKACHPERSCGLFGMYMTYGYAIQFLNLIILGLLLYWKKIKTYLNEYLFPSWILGLLLGINLFGLYTSFCRGAYIGFLVAIPFFFFRSYKKIFLGLLLFIPLLALLSFFLSDTIHNTFISKERLLSNSERISQYEAAIAVAKEKPLLGIGLRNFEHKVSDIKKKYNIPHAEMAGHAHSNFFEYLAANGILGLILIFSFHLFWFIEMVRRNDLIGDLTLPLIVALFVSGQVQYTLGDAGVMFVIMTIYSLSQIRIKICPEKNI